MDLGKVVYKGFHLVLIDCFAVVLGDHVSQKLPW